MLFSFEVVVKTNDTSKYKVGGCLTPDFDDRELFREVSNSYIEFFRHEGVSLKDNVVIKDDCITFADFDIVVISNVLKVLSTNLDFKIRTSVKNDCRFIPSSCEPLFKMEMHRLFE